MLNVRFRGKFPVLLLTFWVNLGKAFLFSKWRLIFSHSVSRIIAIFDMVWGIFFKGIFL